MVDDDQSQSLTISRVISKKRQLKMMAKEIKEEWTDEDFVLDDLSDLIDELGDIVSDNESPVVSSKFEIKASKASQP
jgi:hypothetical protein